MNNLKIIILTLISGLSTSLGNIPLLINKKYKNQILTYSLSLSFTTIFLISAIDLIPNAILLKKEEPKILLFIVSLALIIIGYTIVKIIDKLNKKGNKLYEVGILSAISLIIHNIPEGVICAITSIIDQKIGLKMIFLIMLHNIPEGICISLPIYYGSNNKIKAITYTTISGLGEVIGAILTITLLKQYITNTLLYIILLITSGIMIYLSYKLFKQTIKLSKNKLLLYLGIISGVVVIILTI